MVLTVRNINTSSLIHPVFVLLDSFVWQNFPLLVSVSALILMSVYASNALVIYLFRTSESINMKFKTGTCSVREWKEINRIEHKFQTFTSLILICNTIIRFQISSFSRYCTNNREKYVQWKSPLLAH